MRGGEIEKALLAAFPALSEAPRELAVVGGAVRDVLLGLPPADVDLAGHGVEAEAAKFARRFSSRLVALGRDPLATWRVPVAGALYDFSELTTSDLAGDLRRRDFAMNAVAFDRVSMQLVDPFGGVGDLERRQVRMIEASNFADDPLRVVRAARMAVRFGFEIEAATFAAAAAHAPRLASVAPERVTAEVGAILESADPARGLELLNALGVSVVVFGDLPDPAPLRRMAGGDLASRYACIATGWPRQRVDAHAGRWRWSDALRREVGAVTALCAALTAGELDDDRLVFALHDAGAATAERARLVLAALGRRGEAARIDEAVARRGERIFSESALLSGEEIGTLLGLPPGRAIGQAKRALLERQLLGEVTSRKEAEAWVRGWAAARLSS